MLGTEELFETCDPVLFGKEERARWERLEMHRAFGWKLISKCSQKTEEEVVG